MTLVDEKQAASKLGLSVRTLQKWRLTGCGPEFIKLGHAVRYAEQELANFVSARQRASTSAANSR